MASLELDGNKLEVKDNDKAQKYAEDLGVLFCCKNGQCGTCKTEILEGMENLSEKNEVEEAMDLEKNERLMCQTKILKGNVKIRYTG